MRLPKNGGHAGFLIDAPVGALDDPLEDERMRNFFFCWGMLGFLVLGGCVSGGRQNGVAGCASCVFHMKGVRGCKLAVGIGGKTYLVVGSGIDDHGDAHAADGLCNSARRASISGTIEGDTFVARKFEILEE